MRPFFPFYGSKWNIARYYPKPAHGRVVEPFAGAAGYATFYDATRVDLFDADPIVAGVWDFLIRAKPAEIMTLPEMAEAGDSVDNYGLPQEAKWLIGFWLNRGSAQPKKTRTAYSSRDDRSQLNWGARAKERIASQLAGINEWTITNAPYVHADDDVATWFIDPPYTSKGRFYRVSFHDFGHLATWSQTRRGRVIVCEGTNANWLPFTPLGCFKTAKGHAVEMLHVRDWVGDGLDL